VRIAEIYKSIQGEGFLTGARSAFVRTAGCNLRCRFCDTPYASWDPVGDDLSVPEVLERVAALGCSHVVLTGGEPMLFSELALLCAGLHSAQRHITIETAGTIYLPLECDLMSISPKLSNSTPSLEQARGWRERHERTRCAPDVIRRLISEHSYQLKFVVDAPADCDEVQAYLERVPEIDRRRVLLMPQGTDRQTLARAAEWLTPYCRRHAFHYCPRKQIEWFGLTRGT
jgi:7-carboxy-7-deazaguanine synthase